MGRAGEPSLCRVPGALWYTARRISAPIEEHFMGKGDQRTRRGKIYRGSFGKTRAKDPARKTKAGKPTKK